MTDDTPRQPKGVPVGGQFAAAAHSEPDVTLTDRKPFAFTEEDDERDLLANAPAFDGDTGDDPTHEFLGGGGGLPPKPGGGGSGGGSDDEQRKASRKLMSDSAKALFSKLQDARAISVSAKENGYLRVDDVARQDGGSIDGAATSLNSRINGNTPRGLGLQAGHILGNLKSASIDAVALIRGEIEIVGFGKLP